LHIVGVIAVLALAGGKGKAQHRKQTKQRQKPFCSCPHSRHPAQNSAITFPAAAQNRLLARFMEALGKWAQAYKYIVELFAPKVKYFV
jgi:hypothetical protein